MTDHIRLFADPTKLACNLSLRAAAFSRHFENQQFGIGDGSTDIFQLKDASGTAVTNPTITAIHQTDWQGRVELSPTARTNLCHYSTAFLADAGVLTGSMPAPDGTTAQIFVPDTTARQHTISAATDEQIVGQTYVMRMRVKAAGYTTCSVWFGGIVGGADRWDIDLTTGATIKVPVGVDSVSVTPSSDGYWLLEAVYVPNDTGPYDSFTRSPIFYAPNTQLIPADGVSGVAFWGLEIYKSGEQGVFIPTTGSPVTVTDYTANSDGSIILGQAPQDAAVLDWTGTGTPITNTDNVALPFRVKEAYRATLDFAGNHGDVSIQSWHGNLPEGATVTVDQDAEQVVVTWPAFEEVPAQDITIDAENLNFETGDATGWDCAVGITIVENGPPFAPPWDPASLWSAQYADQSGEAEIVNQVYVPITSVNQSITASNAVYQGRSSDGHASGAVRLKWYDKNKLYLSDSTGNWVTSNTDSVGHAEWHGSHVTATPPANAYYMRLTGVFDRTRENKPLWIDTFEWDGAFTYHADPSKIGHAGEDPIPLSVTIRDERGCRATWSGEIRDYAVYLTSQIYGLEADDSNQITGGSLQLVYVRPPVTGFDESSVAGGSLQSINIVQTVSYGSHSQPQDDTDSPQMAGGSLQSISMVQTVSYGAYAHAQDDADSPVMTSGLLHSISMVVTADYQTHDVAQNDADSPVMGAGTLTSISMTNAA